MGTDSTPKQRKLHTALPPQSGETKENWKNNNTKGLHENHRKIKLVKCKVK